MDLSERYKRDEKFELSLVDIKLQAYAAINSLRKDYSDKKAVWAQPADEFNRADEGIEYDMLWESAKAEIRKNPSKAERFLDQWEPMAQRILNTAQAVMGVLAKLQQENRVGVH